MIGGSGDAVRRFMGWRAKPGRVLLATTLVVGVGSALSAWWVLPLMSNRHWMANFGTLFSDIGTMLGRVLGGAWAQHMSPAIGWAIDLGVDLVHREGQSLREVHRDLRRGAVGDEHLGSVLRAAARLALGELPLPAVPALHHLREAGAAICAAGWLLVAAHVSRWARFAAGDRDRRAWLRLVLGRRSAIGGMVSVGLGAVHEARKNGVGRSAPTASRATRRSRASGAPSASGRASSGKSARNSSASPTRRGGTATSTRTRRCSRTRPRTSSASRPARCSCTRSRASRPRCSIACG